MFLAVDIGNSNIVIAVHNGAKWIHKIRYETKEDQPKFYYEARLRDILLEWGISASDINASGVSSVVPEITEKIIYAVSSNVHHHPVLLGPELFIKMDMKIPKVYEIGSDLVSNAVATRSKYGKNCIIVDFGTALTFTIYEHNVGITGVTIAPGLKTIISTLSGNTSQLPEIEIKLPKSAIGTSTSTAIRSGVLFGFIGMLKEILSRIKAELNDEYYVVATGGLSTALEEFNEQYDEVDKDMTLDGIRLISTKS